MQEQMYCVVCAVAAAAAAAAITGLTFSAPNSGPADSAGLCCSAAKAAGLFGTTG